MTKRHVTLVALIVLIAALFATWRNAQPQECPTFQLGETAYIYAGDAFDGRPVKVFQPGWTANGAPVYVVELIALDANYPTGGYIAATGCELQRP
jgi:hypothetical protein